MDYQRQYSLLIESRKQNPTESDYCEKHHILPRSLGGSDIPENIIQLTAREHYMAHRLLAKIHGGKMWFALWIMSNGAKPSSKRDHLVTPGQYEYAKRKQAEWFSANHPFKGKKNVGTSAYRGWDAKRIEYDWSVINRIHELTGFNCAWRYRGHTWTQERRKSREMYGLGKYFTSYANRGNRNKSASKVKWLWQHKHTEVIACCTIIEGRDVHGMCDKGFTSCTYGRSVTCGDWKFLGPLDPTLVSEANLERIVARKTGAHIAILTCPHCGYKGKRRTANNFHFDKCKHKYSEASA